MKLFQVNLIMSYGVLENYSRGDLEEMIIQGVEVTKVFTTYLKANMYREKCIKEELELYPEAFRYFKTDNISIRNKDNFTYSTWEINEIEVDKGE